MGLHARFSGARVGATLTTALGLRGDLVNLRSWFAAFHLGWKPGCFSTPRARRRRGDRAGAQHYRRRKSNSTWACGMRRSANSPKPMSCVPIRTSYTTWPRLPPGWTCPAGHRPLQELPDQGPKSPQRAEVEERIRTLQKQLEDEEREASGPRHQRRRQHRHQA